MFSVAPAFGRLRGWLWPFWLSRGCSLRNGQQRATAHRPGDAVFCLVGGDLQVVMALQIQPPAGAGREVTRKPQGRVRRDGSLAAHNVVDADRRHADGPGQRGLAETQRLHEIMEQDFTGMNRRDFLCLHRLNGNPLSQRCAHLRPATESKLDIGR